MIEAATSCKGHLISFGGWDSAIPTSERYQDAYTLGRHKVPPDRCESPGCWKGRAGCRMWRGQGRRWNQPEKGCVLRYTLSEKKITLVTIIEGGIWKRRTTGIPPFLDQSSMIKPTNLSQKKSMGWLFCVCVGFPHKHRKAIVVDKSMNDGEHCVLHRARCIKVAPFWNAVNSSALLTAFQKGACIVLGLIILSGWINTNKKMAT